MEHSVWEEGYEDGLNNTWQNTYPGQKRLDYEDGYECGQEDYFLSESDYLYERRFDTE